MSERTLRERVQEIGGHKYIQLKSGRRISFWDAITEVETADTRMSTAFSRAFKLAGTNKDPDLAGYELERLEDRIRRAEWDVAALRKEIDRRLGVRSQQERIALLRNTTGRTPVEAAEFRRKADELERQLDNR
jgi:hypothetical protein